jgi:hypothetical protein
MRQHGPLIAVSAIALAFFVYFMFILDLEGQSMASHMGDVWNAKVTQDKLVLISESLERKIEAQLRKLDGERKNAGIAAQKPEPEMQARKEKRREEPDHPDDDDRKALDDLLESHN